MITLVGNLKGGCGKSTVTFNLGIWLINNGVDVALFDLDPQATLSDAAEVRAEEGIQPEVRVFRPDSNPSKIFRDHPGGEILVDVGASNLWAMRQAISMAHRILVPVPPSQADVWSTQRFLHMIDETVADKEKPEVLLFINRADTHPGLYESSETEQALTHLPGVRVNHNRLCQRTVYRRSFSEGRAVFEMDPHSKAAQEFALLAASLFPGHVAQRAKAG